MGHVNSRIVRKRGKTDFCKEFLLPRMTECNSEIDGDDAGEGW